MDFQTLATSVWSDKTKTVPSEADSSFTTGIRISGLTPSPASDSNLSFPFLSSVF